MSATIALLIDPLRGDFGPLAGLQMLLVGAGCGCAGVWVIQFGRAYLAESFTHALLPGLVIATLAGAGLVAGALLGTLAAYAAVTLATRTPSAPQSAVTPAVITTFTAAGVLLASSRSSPIPLTNLLFGDPLAASTGDLAASAALATSALIVAYLMHDRFSAIVFDRGAARSLGLHIGALDALVIGLLVCAVSVAANVAGSLLALALLTGPALGALGLTRRIATAIVLATALGASCGLAGILLSYYADWPASASVALLASLPPMLAAPVQWIKARSASKVWHSASGAIGSGAG